MRAATLLHGAHATGEWRHATSQNPPSHAAAATHGVPAPDLSIRPGWGAWTAGRPSDGFSMLASGTSSTNASLPVALLTIIGGLVARAWIGCTCIRAAGEPDAGDEPPKGLVSAPKRSQPGQRSSRSARRKAAKRRLRRLGVLPYTGVRPAVPGMHPHAWACGCERSVPPKQRKHQYMYMLGGRGPPHSGSGFAKGNIAPLDS